MKNGKPNAENAAGRRCLVQSPDKLLSEQGKALVSSDPDLSERTLRLLSEIEQHKDEDMKCSFEDVCFYDKGGHSKSVGLACLSICIKGKPVCFSRRGCGQVFRHEKQELCGSRKSIGRPEAREGFFHRLFQE